jgi:type I restriction enzyme R subunit
VEVAKHAHRVRFWHNPLPQEELRKKIIHALDDRNLFDFAEQAAVADRLMELSKANQALIAKRHS